MESLPREIHKMIVDRLMPDEIESCRASFPNHQIDTSCPEWYPYLAQIIHHVPIIYGGTTGGWWDFKDKAFILRTFYKVDHLKIHFKPILRRFFASQWQTRDICASRIEIKLDKFNEDEDRDNLMNLLSAAYRLVKLRVIVKYAKYDTPDLAWFWDIVQALHVHMGRDFNVEIKFDLVNDKESVQTVQTALDMCPKVTRVDLAIDGAPMSTYWRLITATLSLSTLTRFDVHLSNHGGYHIDEKLIQVESQIRQITIHNHHPDNVTCLCPWSLVNAPRLDAVTIVSNTAGMQIAQGLEPRHLVTLTFGRGDDHQPKLWPHKAIMHANCPYMIDIKPNYPSALLDTYDYLLDLSFEKKPSYRLDAMIFEYKTFAPIFDDTFSFMEHLVKTATTITIYNCKKAQIANINMLYNQIESGVYIVDDEFVAHLEQLETEDTVTIDCFKADNALQQINEFFDTILYEAPDI